MRDAAGAACLAGRLRAAGRVRLPCYRCGACRRFRNARGNARVSSDLDPVAVVTYSARPFAERPLDFDLTGLPVPGELIVYTEAEWHAMRSRPSRFQRALETETVWIPGEERSGRA